MGKRSVTRPDLRPVDREFRGESILNWDCWRDGDDAIFGADVKPASVNVLYSARLADGRTKYPSEMKLVPRPVVTRNEAWLLLPEFCGKNAA